MNTYSYNITGLHGGSYTVLTGAIRRDHKPCENGVLLEALTNWMAEEGRHLLAFEPLCISVYGGANNA